MNFFIKTIKDDMDCLRRLSEEVNFKNSKWKEAIDIIDNYSKSNNNIIAISAIQLGIPLRIVYYKHFNIDSFDDITFNNSKILINPKIIRGEGLTKYWESCASCLDNLSLVERPYKIEIEFYDENKEKHINLYKGFEATILCHEIDHLDGILCIDKALEIKHMEECDRKTFRKLHPYEIIRKKGIVIENIK